MGGTLCWDCGYDAVAQGEVDEFLLLVLVREWGD